MLGIAPDDMQDTALGPTDEQRRKLTMLAATQPKAPVGIQPAQPIPSTSETLGIPNMLGGGKMPSGVPATPPSIFGPSSTSVARPQAMPPSSTSLGRPTPAYDRFQTLEDQGRPQLHGIKKVLDIASQVSPLGKRIESAIPGSPGYYDAQLGQAKTAADEEMAQERTQNPPEVAAIRAQAAGQLSSDRAANADKARQEQHDWKVAADTEHQQFLSDMASKKRAATPYQEWAANPQVYDAYLKAQGAAKQSGRSSIMSPYAAVKLADYAYMYDPRLLPFAQAAMKSVAQQIGMQLPPGMDISTPPAGQPVDETGNPIGLRQPGAPTGATRGRGQFAEAVIPSMNDAKQQIASLGGQLGPMAGRWHDLYTGKVGAYGPQFSGLQTSLKNIGTAWMRLHANSEKARQDFEAMLSASQDPANLAANLDAIEKQAEDYVAAGKGRPNKLGKGAQTKTGAAPKVSGPPQGVSVPQGWKWQQQDGKWGITDGKSFRPYSGQ